RGHRPMPVYYLLYCVAAAAFSSLALLYWLRRGLFTWAVLAYRSIYLLRNIRGPPNYPIVGSLLDFKWNHRDVSYDIERKLRAAMMNKSDPIGMFKAWIGPVPLVVLLKARHNKALLESNSLITKPWMYDIISEWLGRGLLTSTSEKWHSRRKIITPTFQFNILKGYRDVFVAQGRVLVDQLESFADTGRELDLFPFVKRCALDIIAETAMGTQLNTQTGGNAEYCEAVDRMSNRMFEYMLFPPLWIKPIWFASGRGGEFYRLVKNAQEFTLKVIRERRQIMQEEGLLDARDDDEDAKSLGKKSVFIDMLLLQQAANALSDEDIREEVGTFMFEGHDTTASAMGFTIWFLGQYPQCQKLVHEEIDSVFGDDKVRDPTEADLRRLPYFERCIKEALRLMPSVPFIARVLSHDFEIEGVTLPKNLPVIVAPWICQRDPDHWERPDEFFPDHFMPEKVATRDPYAYVPFSAGPRNCVGQKFAIAEEKTVLSWFFRRYSVESMQPFPDSPMVPELIIKPLDGFLVHLYKRH
ncbi:hypothetical protein PMAYCL1PPCAC_15890, partial [Pristionchus mayeri]